MDFEIVKTDSQNIGFVTLIKLLDEDLEERYGQLQKQYEKHNRVDYINDVVVMYKGKAAIACGAFKEYDTNTIELKRMFVIKEHRKQGLAKAIIKELEDLAMSRGFKYAVLETGIKQYEAIGLYKSIGYCVTQNYGPYIGNPNSVCMRKKL
ncbi:MAG TPA: GNAT family N-acetyltransferase [Candidatus Nitrosocosmicus sp.]|nr:GNAT family N-acetyltransferase [Candidatus Nitrosocosmicus sp.]